MFRYLQAEQARMGLTNQEVADRVGISRVSYESKKKKREIYCERMCPIM